MLGTECVRCFRAPSKLTPSKALRSANGNCKIKAPDLNLQLLPPHPPKFNVELASVCQRSALRGSDRSSNPSQKSTLSFGGRGLLFCRTRSRQFLLCICFSRHDVAKTKAASQPKTKPTAQLHSQRSRVIAPKPNSTKQMQTQTCQNFSTQPELGSPGQKD